MPSMQVTLTLEATPQGTKMASGTTFEKPEDLKTVLDMGMQEGFTQKWESRRIPDAVSVY